MIQECKRCLMNSAITKYFYIDDNGICNYCRKYEEQVKLLGDPKKRNEYIVKKIDEIKKYGKNKPYDCILGLSGGRDSSYLTWWLKQQGLRVLLIHLDNGWNSELSVQNINKLCNYTGYDLYTHVIEWNEFRELQKAYFRADVIDIEALTDHAIYAIILKKSVEFKIKYIITGMNISTESVMPKDWVFKKRDSVNILDIVRKNSNVKIKTYPYISFTKNLFYHLFHKLEIVDPLNYLPYNVEEAEQILISQAGWVPYSRKHGESTFTKFYQNYILPQKFKVDKRYAHLSNLICSGQITKPDAIKKLSEPLYEADELKTDIEYFLKKMQMSEEEFNNYLNRPPVPHTHYKTDQKYWNIYFKLIRLLKKIIR